MPSDGSLAVMGIRSRRRGPARFAFAWLVAALFGVPAAARADEDHAPRTPAVEAGEHTVDEEPAPDVQTGASPGVHGTWERPRVKKKKKAEQNAEEAEPGEGEGKAEAGETTEKPTRTGGEGAPEKPKNERIGWTAVPIVTYAPETSLGLGGLFVLFFREPHSSTDTRPSNIAPLVYITLRRQVVAELQTELYFRDELWLWESKFDYELYPDYFWGIGNDVVDSDKTRYEEHAVLFHTEASRQLWRELSGGLAVDLVHMKPEYSGEGVFAREDFPGEQGGLSMGVGPFVRWDTRDSSIAPRQGDYDELRLTSHPLWLGSDYRFTSLTLDVRHYFPIRKKRLHVIAARAYGEVLFGDAVPYYQLAQLGGDQMLRGYYHGHYRDRTMFVTEVEYRTPIWWRIGGVLFAGVGEVAPKVVDMRFSWLRWAVGGGVRVAISRPERLNLRADVGVGYHSWGAYLSAAEVF